MAPSGIAPADGRVFDRRVVGAHRRRAAKRQDELGAEFLFQQNAVDLIDRLGDINRRFKNVLIAGCRRGALTTLIGQNYPGSLIIQGDSCPEMARQSLKGSPAVPTLAFDEEFLPFGTHGFDLILSPLSMHWLNDLPGALVQMQRALIPDGLLMVSLLGGDTLAELRQTIFDVETDLLAGVSPRTSPILDLRDAAGLMQRAGFSLPVADIDTFDVSYDSALGLLRDLRAMGETSALIRRDKRVPPRAFWPTVIDRYDRKYTGSDGRVCARFEIITLTGWHPHATQQQPSRPGSAKTSLADRLGTVEQGAGDKVR